MDAAKKCGMPKRQTHVFCVYFDSIVICSSACVYDMMLYIFQTSIYLPSRRENVGAARLVREKQLKEDDMDKIDQDQRAKRLGSQPVISLLLKFSIPAIVGMLVNALYNIVDRIFIGRAVGGVAIEAERGQR